MNGLESLEKVMTRNFDCALKHAKELVEKGENITRVIAEVADDYVLTQYETNELKEELYENHL